MNTNMSFLLRSCGCLLAGALPLVVGLTVIVPTDAEAGRFERGGGNRAHSRGPSHSRDAGRARDRQAPSSRQAVTIGAQVYRWSRHPLPAKAVR